MKIKTLMTALMLGGAVFSSAVFAAEEAPAAPAQGKRPNMRRGGQNRFSPEMMFTMLVGKELKAYNENKTEENYKKLEEAVKKASGKLTEEFLKKAKAGEIKMPARQLRGRGGRGGKGAKRPAKNQD